MAFDPDAYMASVDEGDSSVTAAPSPKFDPKAYMEKFGGEGEPEKQKAFDPKAYMDKFGGESVPKELSLEEEKAALKKSHLNRTQEQLDLMDTDQKIQLDLLRESALSRARRSPKEQAKWEHDNATALDERPMEFSERYLPLHGAGAAGEEGIKSGIQLAGDGVAGQTIGVGLGALNILGTAFNPVMAAGQDIAKVAQATGATAGGDAEAAVAALKGLEEILPNLKASFSERGDGLGTFKNFLSDIYVQIRKDPVNSMLVIDGIGKLGVSGFAARQARLGKPLSPFLVENFPEAGKIYARQFREFNQEIGPIDSGRNMKAGVPMEAQAKASLRAGVTPEEFTAGKDLPKKDIPLAEADYGIDAKPSEPIGTVAVRNSEGNEIHSVVTDAEHLPAVVEAADKVAGKGDTVSVENPQKVIEERLAKNREPVKPVEPIKAVEEPVKPTKKSVPTLDGMVLDADKPAAPSDTPLNEARPIEKAAPSSVENLKENAGKMGIPVEEAAPTGAVKPTGAVTRLNREGAVKIILSKLLEERTGKIVGGEELKNSVHRHELIHAALAKKWVDDWTAAGGLKGTGKDAIEYVKGKRAEIYADIKSSMSDWESTGRRDIAERIKQSLLDSWNIYHGEPQGKLKASEWAAKRLREIAEKGEDIDPASVKRLQDRSLVKTPQDLIDLMNKSPEEASGLVSEFVRQLQEIKDRNITSEVSFRQFIGKMLNWMKDSLNNLRNAARDAEAGVYGDRLKEALRDTDETLARADYEGQIRLTETERQGIKDDFLEMGFSAPEGVSPDGGGKKPSSKPVFSGFNKWFNGLRSDKTPNIPIEVKAKSVTNEAIQRASRDGVIESLPKRLLKQGFIREAAVDTLIKAGGVVRDLGEKIKAYLDTRDSRQGQMFNYLYKTLDKIPKAIEASVMEEVGKFYSLREGVDTDMAAIKDGPSKERAYAARTAADRLAADEFYKNMTPHAKELVDTTNKLFEYMGQVNESMNVMNLDPATGLPRPIGNYGKFYYPKILKDSVREILENPTVNPAEHTRLIQMIMEKNGFTEVDQVKRLFAATGLLKRESARKLGSLEQARTNYLPNSFYELDWKKTIPSFVAKWSDRISQIQHFGQEMNISARGMESLKKDPSLAAYLKEEGTMDAFSRTLKDVQDPKTIKYIEAIRDYIYGKGGSWDDILAKARTFETATKLSSPMTALTNLLGGTISTVTRFGPTHTTLAAYQLFKDYKKNIRNAQEAGALKHDLQTVYADTWDLNEQQRQITDKALKASGFNFAEQVTRTTASLTGLQWGRWALKQIEKNPNSKASLWAKNRFKQYGVSEKLLRTEGFDGVQAKRLMREAAMDTQFSYDLRQVPVWMESAEAKTLFQFQKFGVQAVNAFEKNVVKPALGIRLEDGKKYYDFKPLIALLAAGTVGGEIIQLVKSGVFGKDRNDSTFTEMVNTANDGEYQIAMKLFLKRVWHDQLFSGLLGAAGDIGSMVEDYTSRGKSRSIISAPALASAEKLGVLLKGFIDQKKWVTDDFLEYAKAELPAANYVTGFVKNITGNELYARERALKQVRALGYRYLDEVRYERFANRPVFGKTVNTHDYNLLQNALMVGDRKGAKEIIDRMTSEAKSIAQRDKIMTAMKASVRARQPFKVGAVDAANEIADFKSWAKRRADPETFKAIEDLNKTYLNTARSLNLF